MRDEEKEKRKLFGWMEYEFARMMKIRSGILRKNGGGFSNPSYPLKCDEKFLALSPLVYEMIQRDNR